MSNFNHIFSEVFARREVVEKLSEMYAMEAITAKAAALNATLHLSTE